MGCLALLWFFVLSYADASARLCTPEAPWVFCLPLLLLVSFEAKQYMDLVSFRISPNGSRQSAGLPEFHAALHSDLVRHMRLVFIWHFAFSNKSVPFCWYSLVGLFCSFVSDGMWGLNLGVRFGSSFCLLPCCTFTVPPSNLILWDLI